MWPQDKIGGAEKVMMVNSIHIHFFHILGSPAFQQLSRLNSNGDPLIFFYSLSQEIKWQKYSFGTAFLRNLSL